MEIQVQELIDKIKKDGVETATQEAAQIKAEAQLEARRIVDLANKEAERHNEKGTQDVERSVKAGTAALEQASRNLILVFKDEIQALLNKIIAEHISANYNDDVLKAVLPVLLKSWVEKQGGELCVLLPENELNNLRGFFNEKLTEELLKGIELKSSRKLTCGFHISNKEGSVYYDFSADAVAQMLSNYLNPKLAEIVKTSAKGI